MAEKAILTKEHTEKILKLLRSKSEDDQDLALSIVDNCNIEKSFEEILYILSSHQDSLYTLNTPLIKSKNIQQYIVGDLLLGAYERIPVEPDLNFLLDLWERHHKIQIVQGDLQVRKRLISAYVGKLSESSFEFKPHTSIEKVAKNARLTKGSKNIFKNQS
jgi:hypothetical protein